MEAITGALSSMLKSANLENKAVVLELIADASKKGNTVCSKVVPTLLQ